MKIFALIMFVVFLVSLICWHFADNLISKPTVTKTKSVLYGIAVYSPAILFPFAAPYIMYIGTIFFLIAVCVFFDMILTNFSFTLKDILSINIQWKTFYWNMFLIGCIVILLFFAGCVIYRLIVGKSKDSSQENTQESKPLLLPEAEPTKERIENDISSNWRPNSLPRQRRYRRVSIRRRTRNNTNRIPTYLSISLCCECKRHKEVDKRF